MTPREPDRFEAKAAEERVEELYQDTIRRLGERKWPGTVPLVAMVRAAESDALEKAAQEYGKPELAYVMVACRHVAQRIRALASPAAAPAAERTQCQCIIGAVAASCVYATPDRPCECACHAPPSAPAPPEKEIANLLGRGHARNPREGEPGDAETYSSPPPLLPRVLAALEQEASNHDEYDSRYEYERAALLRALADELRAYIAERAAKAKGEGR